MPKIVVCYTDDESATILPVVYEFRPLGLWVRFENGVQEFYPYCNFYVCAIHPPEKAGEEEDTDGPD